MGAEFSRFTDSIAKRTRRSSSTTTVQPPAACETSNGISETGHDPAVHGAKLEDRNYNNESYKMRPGDPHDAHQKTDAATTIQAQYRQFSSKEETKEMRNEDAAIKIQAGFRGYQSREQVRQIRAGRDAEAEEEDIDIDLSSQDVENAAIIIQAGFKGFKARKELSASQNGMLEDTPMNSHSDMEVTTGQELTEADSDNAATKIQAGYRGHITRKQLKEQELQKQTEEDKQADEIVDIDLTDPDVERSAVKIQAGFKGLKARKELRKKSEERRQQAEEEQQIIQEKDADEAAVKIQSAFRGHMTRSSIKQSSNDTILQSTNNENDDDVIDEVNKIVPVQDVEEVIDIDLTDPEVKKATMKLQAGFKSLKARKEMQRQEAELKAHVALTEESQVREELTIQDEIKQDDAVTGGAVLEETDAGQDDHPERVRAASIIQAGFREMKTRNENKDIQDNEPEDDNTQEEKKADEEEEDHVSKNEPDEM